MKRVLTTCAIAVMMFLSSCKKDKTLEYQQEKQPMDLTAGKLPKPANLNFKASDVALKASSQSLVNAFMSGNSGGAALRPGFCPVLSSSASILSEVTYSCIAPTTTLVYQISVIELPAIAYQFDYSFELQYGGIFPLTGTFSSPTETILCPDWNPNGQTGECPVLKVFQVTFVMNTSAYETTSTTTAQITALCQKPGSTPSTLFNTVSLDYSCTDYINSPAIIYLTPGFGSFTVLSQCALVCHNPHFQCPGGGVFNYRQLPGGSWQSVNLPFGSIINHPAASGTYEYSCTLNYSCGTTLPVTGTFVVN